MGLMSEAYVEKGKIDALSKQSKKEYTLFEDARKIILHKGTPFGIPVIVAERGSGKTRLLCELAMAEPNKEKTVLMSPNNQMANNLLSKYQDIYDKNLDLPYFVSCDQLTGKYNVLQGESNNIIYLDEPFSMDPEGIKLARMSGKIVLGVATINFRTLVYI